MDEKTESFKIRTKEDFELFLRKAEKLKDSGVPKRRKKVDPRIRGEVMNFVFN